jgi:15-cis-phytoene synthase
MHAMSAHPSPPLVVPPVLDAAGFDLAACERLMRSGSKSFFAASRVLPARVRSPAVALYAFCRVADDEVDLQPHDTQAVPRLLQRLDRIYAGTPDRDDADEAMACVVRRFSIPRPLPAALIEGFAWDAEGRRYETLEALLDYCARVAGTVGAMMALVMDTVSPQALARACELGCAMQLTNIARDVGEDARNGRLYLPRQWLREEGIDPDAWLAAPRFEPGIARTVQRLLDAADGLYRRAEQGVAALPRDCRPAIQAARLVYAEIGAEVQRARLDSVNRRAVVSSRRKAVLMARAMTAAVLAPSAGSLRLEPLAAIRPLVDACLAAPMATREPVRPVRVRAEPTPASRGNFYQRTLWVIELLETVEHRNRQSMAGNAGTVDGR